MKRIPLASVKRIGHVVLLAAAVIGASQSECGLDDKCASSSWEDQDGDLMSTATEDNPKNLYLNLDPDRYDSNPSIASGTYGNGLLLNGLNLRDLSGKCGYLHYRGNDPVDTDDWGVATLLAVIEVAAFQWKEMHESFRMQPGDMSLEGGGPWEPDHLGHENGTEVDVRYVREDHAMSSVSVNPNDGHYGPLDVQATKDVIGIFQGIAQVEAILVNSAIQLNSEAKIVRVSDHADHFHVRISDPDGSN